MNVATAHSMRGDPEPADWPRLTPEDVGAVLELWGIAPQTATLRWHSPRPLSAAAIVDFADRSVVVKRHHVTVRTPVELEEEHGFLRHLSGAGVPVSRVLETPDGRSAAALGAWSYELHALGAGVDRYRDAVSWSPFTSAADARAAGAALGAMHRAARHYDEPPRAATLLVSNDRIVNAADPLAVIQAELEQRPALGDYLGERDWPAQIGAAIRPFHERYIGFVPQLAKQWTHNDWHASNLLWSESGARVTTILDFGLCDRTTAVYDLATAIERNTIPWLDIHDGQAGAADGPAVTGLLRGYLAETPLTPLERAALVELLPLVHVGYALSEIDYFHGITHSAANADLAYRAFLLGHCRWFLSPEGRSLIAHIRAELQVGP